jgi:hypothetical protein
MSVNISICAGVKDAELAIPLRESLGKSIPLNVIVGDNYQSFSKMVNGIFHMAGKTSDIIIFCSHRVRPKPDDITRMVKLISEGYGLVMFKRLAFFGCKRELFNKVGFFDERFVPAGYEDDDYFLRMQENNISIYEDNSVEYIPGTSLWQQELKKYVGVEFKQPITYEFFIKKWKQDHTSQTITRLLPEADLTYNIPESKDTIFKHWNQSVFLPGNYQVNYTMKVDTTIKKKKILLFGGSGSLGNKLIDIMGKDNEISIFSRDENKHWHMSQKYTGLNYIIGDIRDSARVEECIRSLDPHIIIIASAMKHIDRCEFEVNEALLTNTIGVLNVCKSIQKIFNVSCRIENVIFISTDKACSPTNAYGMTKSLSERVMVEYSLKMKNTKIKFTNCRYGNVLDSRGSIIPKLKNSTSDIFYLTSPEMTRFIMTQEQAVELIKFSILRGMSGETVIPKLTSMKINDLFEIFAEMNKKNIQITKVRPGEKIHEELLNVEELNRTVTRDGYYIIKPSYNNNNDNNNDSDNVNDNEFDNGSYSSDLTTVSKQNLSDYLSKLELL